MPFRKDVPLYLQDPQHLFVDSVRRHILLKTKEDPNYIPSRILCREAGIEDEYYSTRPHQFITIRLDNAYSLDLLKSKIANIKYKYLDNAILSIERFSKIGENFHLHILTNNVYSKTKIIRDLTKYFTARNVDVKHSSCSAHYENRKNYVLKDKKDEEKQEYIEKDLAFLEKNGFERNYILST